MRGAFLLTHAKQTAILAIFAALLLFAPLSSRADGKNYWCIESGRFAGKAQVKRGLNRALKAGFTGARVEKAKRGYTVLIGPFEDDEKSDIALVKIRKFFRKARHVQCDAPSAVPPPPAASNANLKTLTLEDMGYPKDIHISGVNPELSIYLPNYRQLKHADVKLNLKLSRVLDVRSSLTVLIDDTPLFTKSVKETGFEPAIVFSVQPSKADFIKVTLRGHLTISGDICQDLPTGNLWMVASNQSTFTVDTGGQSAGLISGFFKNYDTAINVVLADDTEDNLSVLPLAYHINRLSDWKELRLTMSTAPIEGVRNIIVGGDGSDITVKDKNLLIARGSVPLLKKTLMDIYITSFMRGPAYNREAGKKTNEVTFADIGVSNFTATGLGDLSFNVPLHYSSFSGIPKNPYLRLFMSHTPVSDADRAFLKIFLNGVMVNAVQLDNAGTVKSYEVKLPDELLKSFDNNLNMVTSYYVNRGECRGSMPNMTVSILNSSNILYDGSDTKHINSVRDVIGAMSGKALVMVDDKTMLSHAFYLMDIIGKLNKNIKDFDVAKWEGNVPESGYDFIVLALANPPSDKLDIALKVKQGRFNIINPLTGNEVFSSEYADGFGVLQAFNNNASKVLLLSYYKNIKPLDYLKTLSKDDAGRMLGNVVIFNNELASYEVGDKFRVEYKEVRPLIWYWNKYKLYAVLVLAILALFFIYFINKRVVRKENND
ncbi:hypothetical protein EPN18_00050 [bacterium]|nr:MAG: hypothetical protein EPN18_00050 [bacterium]